jgi:hypothetical protein
MSFPVVIYADYANQPHFEDTSDKRHILGQRMEYADGRKYRYVLVGGTTLVSGNLLQGKSVVALDYDTVVVDSESAAGAFTVTVTGETTTAANYYADGWMHVVKSAGGFIGYTYMVESHVLFAAAAGKVITLAEPLKQTIAAADEIGLTPNPYNGVIQAPITTLTSRVVGVACTNTTTAQYGWIQSGGLCGVLATDDLVVGNKASAVLAAAGRVGAADGDIDHNIGYAMSDVSASGEAAAVWLTID